MSSKIVKIGIAILGIIFGVVETVSGSKDLIEAIKEDPVDTVKVKFVVDDEEEKESK